MNILYLREIANRSIPAAISYVPFGILVFFYRFNVEKLWLPVQAASVGVIFASALRLFASRTLDPEDRTRTGWRLIRIGVWVSTLCWSIIFTAAAWELQASGAHYVAAMVMMIGFVAVSLITLAYDPWLFFPFNIALSTPPSLIALYYCGQKHSVGHGVMAISALVFLGYQCLQYRQQRKAIEERLRTQVDLEDMNFALKESQDALVEQTLQLVQSNKASALSDMAGGLSHEVNNSLMVILGTLRQLEGSLKGEDQLTLDRRKKIDRMAQAIFRINTVIDGLKYFSQEREHRPLERVALSDVIDQALGYVSQMLRAHGVELTVDEVPGVEIEAHSMELTQAIFTLVKNAQEAVSKLKDPGEHWVRFRFGTTETLVRVRISNGGPRMSSDTREKLFQPFFSTKDVGQGSGLSLSIAKGILREHRGDLYLDEGEEFTCFVIELPRVQV